MTVPANVSALEHLPPGAFTHCILFPIFLQTNGVAIVPDNDPIFVQLPLTDAEGVCASVDVAQGTVKITVMHRALVILET